jgi:DNA mismatch repair protein MSH4
MLKAFLEKVITIHNALEPATAPLLLKVRNLCSPDIVNPPLALIMDVIEPNVTYVKSPLELRNQRTFAVKVRIPSCPYQRTAHSK